MIFPNWSLAVATIVILSLVVWYGLAQFGACRDLGFSVFYCIQHAA